MNKITEVVSFLSANLINIETQNDKINEIPNKKVYQNKESQPGDKVKELYANFQKIRENKNYMKEQKKDAQQNNKNNRNQVKSAEKEINKEISDILKIFKSASKALNSSQILKKNINFGTKNLNN